MNNIPGNISDPVHLFSYGSNGIQQLHERTGCCCTASIKRGYLNNHVRIFAGYSKNWKGGVASIKYKKDEKLYGYITELTPQQLDALMKFEKGYTIHEKMINVSKTIHQRKKCIVFIKDNDEFVSLPSLEYLGAIRTMLNDCGRTKATNIMIRRVENNRVINMGYFATDTNSIHEL